MKARNNEMSRKCAAWLVCGLGVVVLKSGAVRAGAIAPTPSTVGAARLMLAPQGRSFQQLGREVAAGSRLAWYDRGNYAHPLPAPAGESLAVAPIYAGKGVYCKSGLSTSADLLRAMAVATGGRWVRSGSTRVLIDRPESARYALLGPREIEIANGKASIPVMALDEKESRTLSQFGMLAPLDLSLQKRNALREFLRIVYSRGAVAPEGLDLNGVWMRIEYSVSQRNGPISHELELVLPSRDGDMFGCHYKPLGDFPAPDLHSTALRNKSPRLDVPEAAPAEPGGDGAVPLAARDMRLAAPVRFASGTVAAAVSELARAVPVDVMATTQLEYVSVRVVSPRPTAEDLARAIAAATGGEWVFVNNILTLRPDAGIERIAELKPETRQYWLQSALEQVTTSLDGDQRKSLHKNGQLDVAELDARQQSDLKWATRLVYVQHPDTARRALALQDVKLKLMAAGNTSGMVSYEIPRVAGPAFPARAIPLK